MPISLLLKVEAMIYEWPLINFRFLCKISFVTRLAQATASHQVLLEASDWCLQWILERNWRFSVFPFQKLNIRGDKLSLKNYYLESTYIYEINIYYVQHKTTYVVLEIKEITYIWQSDIYFIITITTITNITRLRCELKVIKGLQSGLGCSFLGFFLGSSLAWEGELLYVDWESEHTVRRLALTPILQILQWPLHLV